MASDRYAVITDAFRLLRLTRGKWRTRAELAEALDVHERTVRRIIDALREAGVQITQRPRGAGKVLEYSSR